MPMCIDPEQSLAEGLARIAAILREARLLDAGYQARIFLEEVTGFDRAALLRHGNDRIGESLAATLNGWIARRLAGEPLWRVLGQREFWGLTFAVTPDVLDPRPDTETVVSAALASLRSRAQEPLQIVDLGTGSGAILCALLHEWPQAFGWGVDRSLAAARVAQRNVEALGFSSRAMILQADWASALPDQQFDLVVSNPPYIETAIIPTLEREVREHDPFVALDGGADGLDSYRTIIGDLSRLLRPGGAVVLEVGAGQARAVEALIEATTLQRDFTHRDLGGHDRAVVARSPSPLQAKAGQSAG